MLATITPGGRSTRPNNDKLWGECENNLTRVGMARYRMHTIAFKIRHHAARYGSSPLLDDAISGLDNLDTDIEHLAADYRKALGYPYDRRPGRA